MFRHRHRVVTSVSSSSWAFFTSFSISVLLGFFFLFLFFTSDRNQFYKNQKIENFYRFSVFWKTWDGRASVLGQWIFREQQKWSVKPENFVKSNRHPWSHEERGRMGHWAPLLH